MRGFKHTVSLGFSAISVEPVEMYLELGKTMTITVTVLPENASNKKVTWSSGDENVAIVTDGVVTSKAVGETIITATTVDKGLTATCVVTVILPISEDADVTIGDFSVMTISDVIGYNVGFVISEATASDVKGVVVTLYGQDEKALATNISAGVLEEYSTESNLSAPFDIFGDFDYENDGCWEYSGWLGENANVPTKAEIAVTFKNGVEKTATNENLTGDTSIFTMNVLNRTQKIAYGTIQDAINEAEDDDIVLVGPGTYKEDLLEITKPLTVIGANYLDEEGEYISRTVIQAKDERASIAKVHSTQDVHISWVSFDRASTAQIALYFAGYNDFNYSSVSDCKVYGDMGFVSDDNLFLALEAINFARKIVFERNIVEGPFHTGYGGGIGNLWGATDITIRDNIVDGNNIGKGEGTNGLVSMAIGSCEMTGNIITGVDNGIYQNQISLVIEDNVIYGTDVAISAWPGGRNTHIVNNNLYENRIGINSSEAQNVTITGNKIYDNVEYGVLIEDDTPVNATHNYWGDPNGPNHESNSEGQGDAVSDNVLFYPWYLDEDMTDLSYLDGIINTRTLRDYPSIQDAIDFAQPGDTILVGPGEYEGNLEIGTKNLTLKSVELHAAVIKTQTALNAGSGYGGITVLADGVVIDGFTIQHDGTQAVIHTHDSNDVTIINNHISGYELPRGIDIGYASAQSDSVTIEGNEFTNLNCGIYVNQGNDLTVENNVFNNMDEGAVVFDGTWGNIDNIIIRYNEASDSEYLLYFFNVVGSVTAITVEMENTTPNINQLNELTDTELSNYLACNATKGWYFLTLTEALETAEPGDVVVGLPGTHYV